MGWNGQIEKSTTGSATRSATESAIGSATSVLQPTRATIFGFFFMSFGFSFSLLLAMSCILLLTLSCRIASIELRRMSHLDYADLFFLWLSVYKKSDQRHRLRGHRIEHTA